MRKILQLAGFLSVFALGTVNAQTYLTENFDGAFTGNPAAPAGWTQSRIVLLGDGTPDAGGSGEKDWIQITNTALAVWTATWTNGIFPNAAVSGSNVVSFNDYDAGSTSSALGTRRMLSPTTNLAASTNPFVRFSLFCGTSSSFANLRVIASNDGGVTWVPIMSVPPNADVATFSSATPWQQINVKVPAAFKVATAMFGFEITNTWAGSNYFIDNFKVEEFTPTTITSAGSGGWSLPATWVGGVVPNADNNVVIAATHTVQTDINIARMQNLTVDGVFQYSTTSTTQLNHIFGDMIVSATGLYFSGNTTVGKRTYFGGNLSNAGTINFQPGTSTSGALVWLGYNGNYSGAGTIVNGKVPVVSHLCANGVSYSNPFTISNYCGLYLGAVNATNLTLGNLPNPAAFTTERYLGSFTNSVAINTTNMTQHNVLYGIPLTSSNHGFYFAYPPTMLTTGEEIPLVSGNRLVSGALTMNTHNNLTLGFPLSVGTATGTQNIALSRGIISTTTINLLTLNASATGAIGTLPTTVTSTGLNGGNHGSYVSGPIKINFPAIGSVNRTFPLGVGNAFHTNLPSANARREVVLGSGGLAWTSQTITATIENAPSGPVTGTLTTVIGNRAYRLNMNGGPGLGANNTVQLAYNNSSFGGNDNLIGTFQDIRIVQSPSLTGSWTERSLTAGTGPITGDTPGTRVTTSLTPGPLNINDQYFAWGSTSSICSGAPAAGTISGTSALCSGAATTLSLTGASAGVGITYQWKSSTVTAGPYTNMGSALTQTTGTLATTMYYVVTTSCSISNSISTTPEFTLVVNPNPTVSAVASSTSICFPTTSTVNLTGSGATSYTWSPAASLSSSVGAAVVASPTSNTIYSVVGSFSTGCSASNTIAISANPNPSLTATSASVCANNSVAISVSSPSFAYCQPAYSSGTGSGDYIGGVQLSTITNTTTGLATPFYTLYPTSANTTATLTAGNTYTLFLNPGTWSSSNGMAAWIDYNQNGNLADLGEKLGEVTINGAFPTFSTVVFTVPANSFNGTTLFRVREVYATTNIDPCAGYTYGETEDYNITIVGGVSQFSWTPATYLNSSTGSTVISTPAASTNYTVSTTMNGCVGFATSSVVANITPVAITGNTAICIGGTVNLTASGATTYTWNTSATTASISASPTVNTTYTASGTSSVTGCVGSSTQAVIVNANPTVTAVSSLSLICNGQTASLTASGASTYSWNTSATTSVVAVSPSVTTSYTVTGTSNGCSNSATITQSVSACTGLNNNLASLIGAVVYPNPTTGLFTIELYNGSVKTIEVMDLTGRIVLTNTSSNDKIDFNISNLANGVYFVKVQSNNSVEVIKIVKQ